MRNHISRNLTQWEVIRGPCKSVALFISSKWEEAMELHCFQDLVMGFSWQLVKEWCFFFKWFFLIICLFLAHWRWCQHPWPSHLVCCCDNKLHIHVHFCCCCCLVNKLSVNKTVQLSYSLIKPRPLSKEERGSLVWTIRRFEELKGSRDECANWGVLYV